MIEKSLEELLRSERNSQETAAAIHRCFYTRLRRYIEKKIPPNLAAKADITQLVETTIRRGIELVQTLPNLVEGPDELTKLIYGIARHVQQDKLRRMGAAKRDSARDVSLIPQMEESLASDHKYDPTRSVELSDLADVVIAELEDEKNKSLGFANVCIAQGFSLSEVQDMLTKMKWHVPATATLRTTFQRKRESIRKKFDADA